MLLTGQPLIDLGYAIASNFAKKRSIDKLDESDLQRAVEWLNTQVDPAKGHPGSLNKTKVLSTYWQNNPLAGHNMGVGGKNVPEYRKIVTDVILPNVATRKGNCQVCGNSGIYTDTNRSWFPLGASAYSDPCSFPNLKGKSLCVSCFRALLLVPLGCKFVGGNAYFFHLTDPELLCEATTEGWLAVTNQLAAGQEGNTALKADVKLSGRVALLEIVSGSRWDGTQYANHLKRCPTGATIVAFSNDGKSLAWYQVHLPVQALEFFHALDIDAHQSPGQLRSVFLQWASYCEKSEETDKKTKEKRSNPLFDRLCEDVEQRRSLAFLARAIVQSRKPTEQMLRKEERRLLELYEQIALGKPERFSMLEDIADRINELDERYRTPLLKRLANTRSKESLYNILVQFSNENKANLRLRRDQLRVIYSENSNEVISLLYLLCMAEK